MFLSKSLKLKTKFYCKSRKDLCSYARYLMEGYSPSVEHSVAICSAIFSMAEFLSVALIRNTSSQWFYNFLITSVGWSRSENGPCCPMRTPGNGCYNKCSVQGTIGCLWLVWCECNVDFLQCFDSLCSQRVTDLLEPLLRTSCIGRGYFTGNWSNGHCNTKLCLKLICWKL